MRTHVHWLVLFAAVVTTIGCDRVTKHAAITMLVDEPRRSFLADTVRLEYAENFGGFLSMGADWPASLRTGVLTVGTGFMLLVAIAMSVKLRFSRWPLTGLALIVAGGASNWMDRAMRGSVPDFLNVGIGSVRTGIFNVADVAITLGVGLLLLTELRRAREPATEV